MFNKRILIFTLAVLFVLTNIIACVDNSNTSSQVSFEESSIISDNSSIESSENDESSVEESSEPEIIIPEDTVINFLACPDNLIHPSVYYDGIEHAAAANGVEPDYSDLHNATYDFDHIYENVEDIIASADISYINQESLVGGTSGRVSGYPQFNTPVAMGEKVIDLGFDVVNVAHNHMLDSGNTDYLEFCNSYFEERNVDVIGYYPNQQSTENVTLIEREGISVAFLTYTYGTNGLRIPSSSEFVIPYFDDELVKKQVRIAKDIADIVVVSCHWGYENTYKPNSEQEHYADLLTELGVDIILGMHPHCIQPMEWRINENGEKVLLVYSLGNFVSGMQEGRNVLAGMLSVDIIKDGETGEVYIDSPLFLPIVNHYVRESRVASDDTGYRKFKVYYLEDYTEELAAEHYALRFDKNNGYTLVGGEFTKENLINTIVTYIDKEFLPEYYHEYFVTNENN